MDYNPLNKIIEVNIDINIWEGNALFVTIECKLINIEGMLMKIPHHLANITVMTGSSGSHW